MSRHCLAAFCAAVVFAGGTAHAEEVALAPLLQKLGESALRREQVPACRYTEVTTVTELDSDGKVKGRLIRTYEVTARKGAPPERRLLTEKREGEEVSGALRDERRSGGGDKARQSPFHPDRQALYTFRLLASPGPGRARIAFAPKEKDATRMEGEALVDTVEGRLLSVQGTPSDLPFVVDALNLRIDYAPSACAVQPSHVKVEGKAGILMFKVRFRSETKSSGYTPLAR